MPQDERAGGRTGGSAGGRGLLALVGGRAWDADGQAVQRRLADAAAGGRVVLVPAAAAYEDPAAVVAAATARLAPLGVEVEALEVYSRADAERPGPASAVRDAACVVLADGSPLHLRSVLKGSRLWTALVEAHASGTALVASGSAGTVVCDPMVDPRGGAYTVGLGLVPDLAVLAHHDTLADHLRERSVDLVPPRAVLVGVDEGTALLREPDGSWHAIGVGAVTLYRRGQPAVRVDAGGAVAGLPG
jgi:cyanophycinase